jgi:23S rRNA pseudouridine1911/1915/1917 synthase
VAHEPSSRRELLVEPEHDGMRLDHFLTALLPEQSRAQVQRLIKDGRVQGPISQVRASTAVHHNQTYAVDIPEPVPASPQPEELPILIVYEDPDIVEWSFIRLQVIPAVHS